MSKEERKKARQWAKINLPEYGKLYTIEIVQFKEIKYCRSDVKSITGKPHIDADFLYNQIPNLPELLKDAIYLGTSPDDEKHSEIILWLYFSFEINSKPSYFNIMQTKKGEFRIHSISDEKGFDKDKIKNKV